MFVGRDTRLAYKTMPDKNFLTVAKTITKLRSL